jgi:hypothetical protein
LAKLQSKIQVLNSSVFWDIMSCNLLKPTDVSEEYIVSIFVDTIYSPVIWVDLHQTVVHYNP